MENLKASIFIFLLILFLPVYILADCNKEGNVKLSYNNLNLNMNIPEKSDNYQKTIPLGVMCSGFETASIDADNITTCTYDPSTVSCYVSSNVLWLKAPENAVTCNSNFNLIIDLNELVMDPNISNYNGQIIVSCSNGFHYDSDTGNINLSVNLNKETFTSNPSSLYWSGSRLDNSSFNSQTVYIYGAFQGWYYEQSDNWLEITKSEDGSSLVITPKQDILSQYLPGVYQTTVSIHDKIRNTSIEIPIVVQLKGENDPTIVPLTYIKDSNSATSYFLQMPDSKKFYLNINTEEYFDKTDRTTDISNLKTFVVFYLPNIAPNTYYAYVPTKPEVFVPIEVNGYVQSNADSLYFGKGSIKSVNIGPYFVHGLSGNVEILYKVGNNYINANTIERINIGLYSPEGNWKLVDEYEGIMYEHPEQLSVWLEHGALKACFMENNVCKYSVNADYGDGINELYNFNFNWNNYYFTYSVEQLTENYISGTWKWCDGDSCHAAEKFYGYKNINFLYK